MKTACSSSLHRSEDLICLLANPKKPRRRGKKKTGREGKESSGTKLTRRRGMTVEEFVIPPVNLPALIPPYFCSFPIPPPLLARAGGPPLLPVLWPGLLEAAVAAPWASGKWCFLQTLKLPIWMGINGKGLREPVSCALGQR